MEAQTNQMTKDKLIDEFKKIVAETEELLNTAASAGGEKAGALRTRLEHDLSTATSQLRKLQHAAADRARVAAKVTDHFVHESPWQAIGIAAGVGALVGFAAGVLFNRR